MVISVMAGTSLSYYNVTWQSSKQHSSVISASLLPQHNVFLLLQLELVAPFSVLPTI
jgi:hypothetical protein